MQHMHHHGFSGMTQQCAMLAKEQPGAIDPSGRQKSQCGEGASEVFHFHFLFQVKGHVYTQWGFHGSCFSLLDSTPASAPKLAKKPVFLETSWGPMPGGARRSFLTHVFMWHKMFFSE